MFRQIVLSIVFVATLAIAASALGQYYYDPYWWPRRGYDYAGAPYYPGYGPPYYPGYGPPYYPGYGPPYTAGISPHDPSPWYLYQPYRTAYPIYPYSSGANYYRR